MADDYIAAGSAAADEEDLGEETTPLDLATMDTIDDEPLVELEDDDQELEEELDQDELEEDELEGDAEGDEVKEV